MSVSDQRHPDVPVETFTCVQIQTASKPAAAQVQKPLNRWNKTHSCTDTADSATASSAATIVYTTVTATVSDTAVC